MSEHPMCPGCHKPAKAITHFKCATCGYPFDGNDDYQAAYEIMRAGNCTKYKPWGNTQTTTESHCTVCAEHYTDCPLHSKDNLPHCPLFKDGEK